jgi:hypothetical protein
VRNRYPLYSFLLLFFFLSFFLKTSHQITNAVFLSTCSRHQNFLLVLYVSTAGGEASFFLSFLLSLYYLFYFISFYFLFLFLFYLFIFVNTFYPFIFPSSCQLLTNIEKMIWTKCKTCHHTLLIKMHSFPTSHKTTHVMLRM